MLAATNDTRHGIDLPTTQDLFAPVYSLADYVPRKHPVIGKLRSRAQVMIAQLHAIATAQWAPGYSQELEYDEAREAWLVLLDQIRMTEQFLEGHGLRLFMRDVARHAPDMDRGLREARDGAVENLRHLRAFLAVLFEERDDQELGIDVLPDAPGTARPGPSVDFEW